MAYKLKVLAGFHVQGGRTYKKNEVLESDVNLAETFKGKFQLLQETRGPALEEEPEAEEPKQQEKLPQKTFDELNPKSAPAAEDTEDDDEFKTVTSKPARKKRTRF